MITGRQLDPTERDACRRLAASSRRDHRLPGPHAVPTITVPAGVAEVIRRLYGDRPPQNGHQDPGRSRRPEHQQEEKPDG